MTDDIQVPVCWRCGDASIGGTMVNNCQLNREMSVARRGITADQFLGSHSVALAGAIEHAEPSSGKYSSNGYPAVAGLRFCKS